MNLFVSSKSNPCDCGRAKLALPAQSLVNATKHKVRLFGGRTHGPSILECTQEGGGQSHEAQIAF